MSCLRDRFFIFSNLIKTGAFIFVHFLEYFLLFWDDNVDEESEKFSIAHVQRRGVAFFSRCVAYKGVAQKKHVSRYLYINVQQMEKSEFLLYTNTRSKQSKTQLEVPTGHVL